MHTTTLTTGELPAVGSSLPASRAGRRPLPVATA